MPYTVAGTLKLPETGQPAAGVILKFVALQSISPVLDRSESVIVTSPTGVYSIQLEYNTYSVFATLYDNKPINCGQIVLNSTVATGLDLPTLLNGGYSEPPTPSWIVELQRLANVTTSAAQAAAASAAASSTSAAAAAASAAQASQISGLSTVAEAIGLASLPLPDVWAPLSDSLRLITGYGRDVLVGSDVVARMVNFSRNSTATYIGKDGLLKTAAANEPRFEKEGLLIEGQSTNVFNGVAGASYNWLGSGLTQSAGTAQLPFDVFQKTITSSAFSPTNTGRVLADIYGILNPVASGGGPVTASVIMFGDADAILAADPRLNITSNLPITNITYSAVKLNSGMVRVMWTGTVTAGSATNFTNFQVSWLNRLPSVVVGCYQVETLPFASSYIPTNGAAVTRAADKAWLNVAGNLIPLSAIALEFNSIAPSSFYQAPNLTRYIVHTGDGTGITAYLGRFTTQFEDTGAAQGSTILPGRTVVVGGVSGGKAAIRSGAGLASGIAVKGFKQTEIYLCNSGVGPADRQVFGHVRNLRMYHRDLTADQYKAVV